MTDIHRIRNFSIIAHIDHGKSTLADRFIQLCGGLSEREMGAQVLDSMDLERERGITIKAQSVSLRYRADDGLEYLLNFIDTPGHVDFSYEVSRSLAACEGALLLVDAAQGVEAQSVANCYTAVDQGLAILPVLNKLDLQQADPDRVAGEIEEIIGLPTDNLLRISAKTGEGVKILLEALIAAIPPPQTGTGAVLRALIVDSWFDNYLGVVSLVRIFDGGIAPGDRVRVHSTGQEYEVTEVGTFTPKREQQSQLGAGEVGYVVAGIKDIAGAPVGDTLCSGAAAPLPGFARILPQVYAGMFTSSAENFEHFRDSLAKLSLNDASMVYEPESSDALGFGFRCGFLGTLHMEIVRERLEREYDLELIVTAPTVRYQVETDTGAVLEVQSPSQLPDAGCIREIREPIAEVNMLLPKKAFGAIMQLCIGKRGVHRDLKYFPGQVQLVFELPMSEVMIDLFDRMKSLTRGYGSMDYQLLCYRPAALVRLDVLVGGERVDAMGQIVHRDEAMRRGRALVAQLRALIPRQMFDVPVQAAIGGRILARETVRALRKNVTAKCYGGDVTRKKKLLAKQKAGKKRMKQVGRVEIPQEAFLAALTSWDD